jgi:hypothetical protein
MCINLGARVYMYVCTLFFALSLVFSLARWRKGRSSPLSNMVFHPTGSEPVSPEEKFFSKHHNMPSCLLAIGDTHVL